MEIIVFASYYYPHVGGYEKNIHELAKRLVLRGHHVMVITCDTEDADALEFYDGVLINRVSCWNILGRTFPIPKPTLWFLLEMLWPYENYYDIVITQTRFFPLSFIGMLFAKIRRLPLVHVERGTCHVVTTNRFVALVNKIYDHTIGFLIVKSAKVNVGISEASSAFVKHLKGANTETIYNGIEMPVNTVIVENAQLVRIVYVGRLIYAKGVQDLIVAFKRCSEYLNNLRLIIIGDGNYKTDLMKLAGNDVKIQFLGGLSHEKIMNILPVCDIFVNPSYSEGLPTSVLEAASVGLPIIATDVGGTSEIIEHDVSGLLYKPKDIDSLVANLFTLINFKEEHRHYGHNALKTVASKFSWDKVVQQWLWLLNRINNKTLSAYSEYGD